MLHRRYRPRSYFVRSEALETAVSLHINLPDGVTRSPEVAFRPAPLSGPERLPAVSGAVDRLVGHSSSARVTGVALAASCWVDPPPASVGDPPYPRGTSVRNMGATITKGDQ